MPPKESVVTTPTPTPTPVITDTLEPDVEINKAVTETVGSCSFVAIVEPTNLVHFSYRVTFSEPIDISTFDTTDISNQGTGGQNLLTWSITNCGDNTNFKITVTAAQGNGTITPVIYSSNVSDLAGNFNTTSTTTNNSVIFARVWTQEAYIKAFNAGASDYFGEAVAMHGDTLAISALEEDSDTLVITNGSTATTNENRSNSGAVYIYKRTGVTWVQEAFIKPANIMTGDGYGEVLSLNHDTLVIAAPAEDSNSTVIINGPTADGNNSANSAGAVYVYKRTGSTWIQEAYLKAVNAEAGDYFGRSVSISGDTLIVGASGERSSEAGVKNGTAGGLNNLIISAGAVYVYKRSGSSWSQEAYLKAHYPSTNYYFGMSAAIDDNTLAVGSHGETSFDNTITNGPTGSVDNSGTSVGAVYVFKRTGVSWAQEAYIKASNPQNMQVYGFRIDLNFDTLAVANYAEGSNQTTITNGSTASHDNTQSYSGAVYIYKRAGVNWAQEAYIKAGNSEAIDSFGYSLALSGNTLVVGALREDSNSTSIINGSGTSSNNGSLDSGAVYIYNRTGNSWSQEAYIKSINSEAGDHFGYSVAISGDTIVVGAVEEDSASQSIINGPTASMVNGALNSGAAYVYRNNGKLFEIEYIWGSKTSSSVTLNWYKTGGLATAYLVAYQTGAVAPATCSLGTSLNVGNVSSHTELALSSATQYSFRVCATDGYDQTSGRTFTITTSP